MRRLAVTFMLFLLTFVSTGYTAYADETYLISPVVTLEHVRFNNENWFTLPHPTVAEFTRHTDGSTSGYTENGVPFFQYSVPNELGIRVERFEIEDHYHYIVDGDIVESFEDLSIALAHAYEAHRAG